MKVLHLLRHAKSVWDDPSLSDHDRPLAARGARGATLIGRHLADRGPRPELVLCSSARRAADTLRLVLAELGEPPIPVAFERGLYLTGEQALLERLHQVPDGIGTLLLVAHNPDLARLALTLSGSAADGLLDRVARKLPTAALLTLRFGGPGWRALARGAGRLEAMVTPKDLV